MRQATSAVRRASAAAARWPQSYRYQGVAGCRPHRLAVQLAADVPTGRHFCSDAGSSDRSGAKWETGAEEEVATKPRMENLDRLAFYRWLEESDYEGPVGLTAKYTLDEEKIPIFLDIFGENIAGTRREEGVIQYDLTPDFERKNVYWLLERFASRHALLEHVNQPHYHRTQERFKTDMGGHPLVQICFYKVEPHQPTHAQTRAAVARSPKPKAAEIPWPSVDGQVIVVTGGGGGIGKAVGGAFARKGAIVILLDVDKELVEAAASEVSAMDGMVCDVRDEKAVAKCIESIVNAHGRIDTLVNSAGITVRQPAVDLSMEDFDRIQQTNVRGTWLMTTAVARYMAKERRGNVINIDSLVTHKPLANVVQYAVSKAGVEMMTRGLATEWGSLGIRVNGIAPGFVHTDISQQLWDLPVMKQWGQDSTPLGRMATVDDMVGPCLFLASSASDFITGQTLRVDGGVSAGMHWPLAVGTPGSVQPGEFFGGP
eukprot:TRINITY_DN102778_c0_g1_i1.p1 TRINITY_DN102778_c0_g1~~TRINITY_DN102778_c0_g1_i1.p1  ORF type:complete len:486 (+),score=95.59 TRINITY_DN102778_c0_g1_i1:214-1671(+)